MKLLQKEFELILAKHTCIENNKIQKLENDFSCVKKQLRRLIDLLERFQAKQTLQNSSKPRETQPQVTKIIEKELENIKTFVYHDLVKSISKIHNRLKTVESEGECEVGLLPPNPDKNENVDIMVALNEHKEKNKDSKIQQNPK
ncbi:hypothetical protein QTN25_009134 [Entamoeba marina]